MKYFVLFLMLLFGSSCAFDSTHSQEQPSTAQETVTQKIEPTVKSTPFTFPKLSHSDSKTLDRMLPKKSRQVLEQATELELFEIESCLRGAFPKLEQIESDKFQGCRILKKAVVADANLKQQVLDGLFYGVGSATNGAGCFAPKHGIRVAHEGERVELVICFHCSNFRGISSVSTVGGLISSAPRELFDRILNDGAKN